jgi:hypothetical protein
MCTVLVVLVVVARLVLPSPLYQKRAHALIAQSVKSVASDLIVTHAVNGVNVAQLVPVTATVITVVHAHKATKAKVVNAVASVAAANHVAMKTR